VKPSVALPEITQLKYFVFQSGSYGIRPGSNTPRKP